MGDTVQKTLQNTKKDTFNIKNDLKEIKTWNSLPTAEKGKALQREKLTYLDKMILDSEDDNLKLKHISERKLKNVDTRNFQLYSPPTEFKQKVPAAVKDKKWAERERDKIEIAKTRYDSADLCTVRELPSISEYIKAGGHKEIIPSYAWDGSKLKDRVDQTLNQRIDFSSITDDYISNHVAEMYDYVETLGELNQHLKHFPNYFEVLREEQLVELKCRFKTRESLGKYLVDHMQLHGVDFAYSEAQKGYRVQLQVEANDRKLDKNGKEQKKIEKEAAKAANQKKKDVLIAKLKDQAREKAQIYTGSSYYSSKHELARIDELINSKKELYANYGTQIKKAYVEIKKILSLRDEEIEKQKENLKRYGMGKTAAEKKQLKNLENCNARLDVMTGSLSSYKEFLYCITGRNGTGMVSKEAAQFLQAQGQEDMVDMLRFLAMGRLIKQISHTEKRIEKKERIAELRKKKSDKAAHAEADKLEKELSNEDETVRLEEADRLLIEKASMKKKGIRLKELEQLQSKSVEDIGKDRFLQKYVKDNKLEKSEGVRVSGYLFDPLNKSDKEAFTFMHIAALYKPYKDVGNGEKIRKEYTASEKARKEVVEKGIRPMLDRMLSMTPEKMRSLQCPEKPNVEDPAFWDNYSFLLTGFVMDDYMKMLNDWDVKLSDEEMIKLQAFAKTAEHFKDEYLNYLQKSSDPNYLLYDPYYLKNGMKTYYDVIRNNKKDPEAGRVVSKYRQDKCGLTAANSASLTAELELMTVNLELNAGEKKLDAGEIFELQIKRFIALPKVLTLLSSAKELQKKTKDKVQKEKLAKDIGYLKDAEYWLGSNFLGHKPAKEMLEFLKKSGIDVETFDERLERQKKQKPVSVIRKEDTKTLKTGSKIPEKTTEKKIVNLKKTTETKEGLTSKTEKSGEKLMKTAKTGSNTNARPVTRTSVNENKIIEEPEISKQDNLKVKYVQSKESDIATAALKLEGEKYRQQSEKIKPIRLVPAGGYKLDLEPKFDYERQGYNNCYACSGTALLNQFIMNKDGKLDLPYGQMDLRAYEPDLRSFEEFKKLFSTVRAGESAVWEEEDLRALHKSYEDHIKSYIGEGKKETGNIFELGDFFFSKRDDVMVNRMTFSTPTSKNTLEKNIPKTRQKKEEEEILYNNQKQRFLDQVHKVLKTGNMVSIYTVKDKTHHYRTIAGINDDELKVYDSLEDKFSYIKVEKLLERKPEGNTVELTWLSEIKSDQDILKEHPELTYNEEEGFSNDQTTVEGALNLGQTHGVLIRKSTREAEYAGYIPKRGRKNKFDPTKAYPEYGPGMYAQKRTKDPRGTKTVKTGQKNAEQKRRPSETSARVTVNKKTEATGQVPKTVQKKQTGQTAAKSLKVKETAVTQASLSGRKAVDGRYTIKDEKWINIVSQNPGDSNEQIGHAYAAGRFMEYMGEGNLSFDQQPISLKDEKGAIHKGIRFQNPAEAEQYYDHSSILREMREAEGNKKKGKPDKKVTMEYSVNALRQLSKIQLINALTGNNGFNPVNDLLFTCVKKEFQGKKVFCVTSVIMKPAISAFNPISGAGLNKKNGTLPSFKTLSLPLLDGEFVDKILGLKAEDIKKIAGEGLNDKDIKAFGERLAFLQGKLSDIKKTDSQKAEKDRIIFGDKDWDKKDKLTNLEKRLNKKNDAFFPGLMDKQKVEGVPAKDTLDENGQNAGDFYDKTYNMFKARIQREKTPRDKMLAMTRISTMGYSHVITKEKTLKEDLLGEAVARLFDEMISKEILIAYFEEKARLAHAIMDKYTNLSKSIKVKDIPENFGNKNKDPKTDEKLRKAYIYSLMQSEAAEELKVYRTIENNFAMRLSVGFTNRTGDPFLDNLFSALSSISNEHPKEQSFMSDNSDTLQNISSFTVQDHKKLGIDKNLVKQQSEVWNEIDRQDLLKFAEETFDEEYLTKEGIERATYKTIGSEAQGLINERDKRTPEMKAVVKNIEALQSFLGGNMPPIGAKDAEKELDGAMLMANGFYNRLSKSIDECLKKKSGYGSDAFLKLMLESLKIRCAEESTALRQAVIGYRDAVETGSLKAGMGMTWEDPIRYMRSMFYDLDRVGTDGKKMIETKEGREMTSPILFMKYEKGSSAVSTASSKLMNELHGKDKSRKKEKNVVFKPETILKGADKYDELCRMAIADYDFMRFGDVYRGENASEFKTRVEAAILQDIKAMGKNASAVVNRYQGQSGGSAFGSEMEKDSRLIKQNGSKAKDISPWNNLRKIYNERDDKQYHSMICDLMATVARVDLRMRAAEDNAKIVPGRPIAARNVAVSRLAAFLGIQDMICDSRNACIRSGGKLRSGIVTEHSGGKNASDIIKSADSKKQKVRYSDKAMGELFTLQIFDALCGQIDRKKDNIHYTTRVDKKENVVILDGIRAFEHDMCFGNVEAKKLKQGYNKLSAVDEKSIMGLPVEMLNKLMSMPQEFLPDILGDILDGGEIKMAGERLGFIRGVIGGLVKKKILRQDPKTGKLSYIKKDHQDDRLRQLLMLKEYEKRKDYAGFSNELLYNETDLDAQIAKRRNELTKAGK